MTQSTPQSEPKKRNNVTKRIGGIITILIILGIAIFKGYNYYTVNQHKKMNAYLEAQDKIEQASTKVMDDLYNAIEKEDHTQLSNVVVAKTEELNNLKAQLKKIEPPKEFTAHHKATGEFIDKELEYTKVLQASAQTNQYDYDQLNQYIDTVNKKNDATQKHLINGLEKAKMDYEIQKDGSVTYWYQEK